MSSAKAPPVNLPIPPDYEPNRESYSSGFRRSLLTHLAIAAIVIPWTTGWLGGRELDNAEDNLAMQMIMARAAAREEGRPVEVVAEYQLAAEHPPGPFRGQHVPAGIDLGALRAAVESAIAHSSAALREAI